MWRDGGSFFFLVGREGCAPFRFWPVRFLRDEGSFPFHGLDSLSLASVTSSRNGPCVFARQASSHERCMCLSGCRPPRGSARPLRRGLQGDRESDHYRTFTLYSLLSMISVSQGRLFIILIRVVPLRLPTNVHRSTPGPVGNSYGMNSHPIVSKMSSFFSHCQEYPLPIPDVSRFKTNGSSTTIS